MTGIAAKFAPGDAPVLRREPTTPLLQSVTLLTACLGVLAVGLIDVATGSEVHVVSLYFIPLVLAGWQLHRVSAGFVALFATCVWMMALYENGAHHDRALIWIINFLTQGCAFLVVTLLVSRLSQRLADEQALRRTDTLTGLMSRIGFTEGVEHILPLCQRNKRPVCLAYIDLDNFKNANDMLGHAFGDSLLRQCGTLISHCVRASDLPGRMGGDEFVLLLPETEYAQAVEVCQRIRLALENKAEFLAAGVTASIGIVADAPAKLPIAELMRLADAEMYRVKQQRRKRRAATASRPLSLR